MEIYVTKNGVNAGPYSETEVMARIKDGRYAKTDLAWCEGCTSAVPLIEILCNPAMVKPTQHDQPLSAAELMFIAKDYTLLLLVAVVSLVGVFIPMSDSFERLWLVLITGFWIGAGWRLSKALNKKPWVWVVWCFIPIGNLYALVRILLAAAKPLKSAGIPMKFLIPDFTALIRLELKEANQAKV